MPSRNRNRRPLGRRPRSYSGDAISRRKVYENQVRIRNIVQARRLEVADALKFRQYKQRITPLEHAVKLARDWRKKNEQAAKAGPKDRKLKGVTLSLHNAPRNERNNCIKRKAERRAVLLSLGKVNKAGGAPGPYKRRRKC